MKEYKCRLSNLTLVTFDKIEGVVDELRMKCISSIVLDIVGVISGLFVVIFLSILIPTILYRHRWRIRYLFFAAKRVFRSSKPNSSIHRPFSFDVFLSYADEDRVFVHSVILKGLESDENSLSVCCHLRDFTAGRPIAENIADAIFLSRYTVCVLSEHYLNSYWCMYEYNLARMETELTRGDEDAMILVIMDGFKCHLEKSPLTLLAHIKAKSYLEVPPINEECVQTFVLRLKQAIRI
ncbi:hypothetical protein FSP39_005669 [Pinctada imbricata]|uniref:TIR domain-containing protein n=1 Tax=Pinctada imbricata TaxID=66713 RepID=A0AA88Y6S3_PINIB|nr:hypothetical protein FSP39_005669 [Pinctada imbricata]